MCTWTTMTASTTAGMRMLNMVKWIESGCFCVWATCVNASPSCAYSSDKGHRCIIALRGCQINGIKSVCIRSFRLRRFMGVRVCVRAELSMSDDAHYVHAGAISSVCLVHAHKNTIHFSARSGDGPEAKRKPSIFGRLTSLIPNHLGKIHIRYDDFYSSAQMNERRRHPSIHFKYYNVCSVLIHV